MRRGVVCIGTGKYSSLVPALEANIASERAADVIFCLTDDAELLRQPHRRPDGLDCFRLPWGQLPWPMPTLFRYHAMRAYAPLMQAQVSHLLYCDVDMRVVGDIQPLYTDSLVAVAHPGTTQNHGLPAPYESDVASQAYFLPNGDATYVAGGVQGGPVEQYLAAVSACADAVTADHLAGITATWHDESHWNKYVHTSGQVRVLGAEFCWPELWPVPPGAELPRLLALEKDHHGLRGTKPGVAEVLRDAIRKSPALGRAVRAARDVLRGAGQRF